MAQVIERINGGQSNVYLSNIVNTMAVGKIFYTVYWFRGHMKLISLHTEL